MEWSPKDEKQYWKDVEDLENWYKLFFKSQFDRVRHGSGDALIDLESLKERLEKEGIESVGSKE